MIGVETVGSVELDFEFVVDPDSSLAREVSAARSRSAILVSRSCKYEEDIVFSFCGRAGCLGWGWKLC